MLSDNNKYFQEITHEVQRLNQARALAHRDKVTHEIQDDPYNLTLYFERMLTYQTLKYHDLAAMDAYKTLLLSDEVDDASGEYHADAVAALCGFLQSQFTHRRRTQSPCDERLIEDFLRLSTNSTTAAAEEREAQMWCASVIAPLAPLCLAESLYKLDCLRDAWKYAQKAIQAGAADSSILTRAHAVCKKIQERVQPAPEAPDAMDWRLKVEDLPVDGSARREIYPWNNHETDRTTSTAVAHLNERMREIAPKLEVAATELPVLTADAETAKTETVKQLGVFAKQDIAPGEQILTERSMLTASNRLKEPRCDACSKELPRLSASQSQEQAEDTPVECPDCIDTVFCSQACCDLAQTSYHAAVCGSDIDIISRDVAKRETSDALHTLLVLRALAMAQTQEIHPLDVSEVKYIWGDFADSPPTDSTEEAPRTLPFTFERNVLLPIHLLEKLDIDIFTAPNDIAETWVFNTLYAKTRGTASAKKNEQTLVPEVAAVHPMWCLANHSCNPNMRWNWEGDMCAFAREKVVWSPKGGEDSGKSGSKEGGVFIKKGEEILGSYIAVDVPVRDRREWMMGSLGGPCMCERCQAEDLENTGAKMTAATDLPLR